MEAFFLFETSISFQHFVRIVDTKDRLLNYSRPCYKCKSKIVVICNFNLIHIGNQYDAGSLVSVNTKLIDINSVSFDITCDHCSYASPQEDVLPAQNAIFNCFSCHKKLEFGYGSLSLEETKSYGIEGMTKFKGVIESRINRLDENKDSKTGGNKGAKKGKDQGGFSQAKGGKKGKGKGKKKGK